MTEMAVYKYNDTSNAPSADFGEMISVVVRRWKLVLLTAIIGAILALVASMLIRPTSVARMVVTALQSEDDALNGVSNNNVGFDPGSVFAARAPRGITIYFSTLYSLKAIKELVLHDNLAQILFPKQWDAVTGQWRHPTGGMSDFKNEVKAFFGFPLEGRVDDPVKIRKMMEKIVTFDVLDKYFSQSAYSVEVTMNDPEDALKVLNLIHNQAIKQIRESEIEKVSAMATSLHKMYDDTSFNQYKQNLTQMIIKTEQRLLLLQDNSYPVVVQVIDPPAIFQAPARSIVLWIAAGAVAGAVLASAIILISWLRSLNKMRVPTPLQEAVAESI